MGNKYLNQIENKYSEEKVGKCETCKYLTFSNDWMHLFCDHPELQYVDVPKLWGDTEFCPFWTSMFRVCPHGRILAPDEECPECMEEYEKWMMECIEKEMSEIKPIEGTR